MFSETIDLNEIKLYWDGLWVVNFQIYAQRPGPRKRWQPKLQT